MIFASAIIEIKLRYELIIKQIKRTSKGKREGKIIVGCCPSVGF